MSTKKYSYYRDDLLLDTAHEKREEYPDIALLELFSGQERKFLLLWAIPNFKWHIARTITTTRNMLF